MSLRVDIKRHLESGGRGFDLDIKFESNERRLALFGPSGSGKTLTMQALAGLMRPDSGHIMVQGKTLFDSRSGVDLKPQARRVAYLFQDYCLFPHLTVGQNICFGLQRHWTNPPRGMVPDAAQKWIAAFELDAVLNHYPSEISGGQKQRTALARALAVEPELLLLDEPLAALDSGLRAKMRAELATLQSRLAIPMIIITHDPADVAALADRVVTIDAGRITGSCTPADLPS